MKCDSVHYDEIRSGLEKYERKVRKLPGIKDQKFRNSLIFQIIQSKRLMYYHKTLCESKWDEEYADPSNEFFHPIKAASFFRDSGNIEEAYWMIFLFIHFGKNSGYARLIYCGLTNSVLWSWKTISKNPIDFRIWLATNQSELRSRVGSGGFGNHRKYQSIKAEGTKGTGETVESYVNWVDPPRTHEEIFKQATISGIDPFEAFNNLFISMKTITGFGRLAVFDYLSFVRKMGLAVICPRSPYLENSSGPLRGARLLFRDDKNADIEISDLNEWLIELGKYLNIGMQIIEDSLCNWQKSPDKFKRFRD